MVVLHTEKKNQGSTVFKVEVCTVTIFALSIFSTPFFSFLCV